MTAVTAEQMAEWKKAVGWSHTRVLRVAVPALLAEVERLRESIAAIAEHLRDGDETGAYAIARAALEDGT